MSEAPLTVTLFGGIRLQQGDRTIPPPELRKAEALLVYLVCQARPLPRERIATLLWPEASQQRALGNLSVALNSLRKQIDPWLKTDRQYVGLTPDLPVEVDARRFAAITRAILARPGELDGSQAQTLAEAASLYRGEFLAGFSVRQAPDFEAWVLLEQERYLQLMLELLATLVDFHLTHGQFPQGIQFAQQLLELDPLHELAHRQLMLLYAQNGQRSQALSQFEQCVTLLENELGVEPDEETTNLRATIEAGAVTPISRATRPISGPQLPPATTTFIGREEELAFVQQWLATGTGRLLTITGPGGMGKTRLTLEATRAHAEANSASAWFVPLQAASDLNGLASAIGAALGLTFSGSRPLTEQLTDFLRSRNAILLLDNFEQLVATPIIDFVVTLLQAAPHLRLLVTSRERLNLQAEELLALTGLPLPPANSAALAASPAVKLFVSRARRQQAGFAFREDNREAIHTVCRLAAGLPLALELAAAWIRLLNPTEIAREMQQNLDFLATDSRDLPERHRSIRAAFDASWQLLTAEEQAAFASLAVFRGGFTHEAAADISGISHRLLLTLIDKSLLQRDSSGRYYCHPLAEQYAAAKLAQDRAAATELQRRHGQYFANLLHSTYPHLFTQATAELSLQLASDLDNLRLMWRQAVAAQAEEILDTARAGLFRLLSLRGLINEALELVNLALERLPAASLGLRCQLLAEQAGVYLLLTRYQEGLAAAESGITLAAKAASLPPAIGAELRLRAGDNGWRAGQYPLAQRHLQTGLELALAAKERRLVARIRYCWGITVAYHDQDYARAEGLVREALALWGALADPQGEALANNLLGLFCYDQARWDEGLAFQQQHLAQCRLIGDRINESNALNNLGNLYTKLGWLEKAAAHFQATIDLRQTTGTLDGTGFLGLGNAQRVMGQFAAAAGNYDRARDLFLSRNWLYALSFLHLSQAALDFARGDFPAALEAVKLAEGNRQQHGGVAAAQILTWRGWILLLLGEPAGALQALTAAETQHQQSGDQSLLLFTQTGLARLAPGADAADAARLILAQLAAQGTDGLDYPGLVYWTCYELLLPHDPAAASACLATANAWLNAAAGRLSKPDLQATFLTQLPCHALIREQFAQ